MSVSACTLVKRRNMHTRLSVDISISSEAESLVCLTVREFVRTLEVTKLSVFGTSLEGESMFTTVVARNSRTSDSFITVSAGKGARFF